MKNDIGILGFFVLVFFLGAVTGVFGTQAGWVESLSSDATEVDGQWLESLGVTEAIEGERFTLETEDREYPDVVVQLIEGEKVIQGILHLIPSKGLAFAGPVFGEDGEPVKDRHVAELMNEQYERTDHSPAESRILSRANAAVDVLGDSESDINAYVIFDPLCPHCEDLYATVTENTEAFDHVRWSWIPVGKKDSQSYHIASAILGSDAPVDHLRRFMDTQALPDMGSIDPESGMNAVNENMTLKESLSIEGTPYIVLEGPDGQTRSIPGNIGKDELEAAIASVASE